VGRKKSELRSLKGLLRTTVEDIARLSEFDKWNDCLSELLLVVVGCCLLLWLLVQPN